MVVVRGRLLSSRNARTSADPASDGSEAEAADCLGDGGERRGRLVSSRRACGSRGSVNNIGKGISWTQ